MASSPTSTSLPDISVSFQTEHNGTDAEGNPIYLPYLRDPDTLARPWAIPGTPGLMHRVGGLEKADKTGNVNYTPENHALMGNLRAAKIERIADDYPELEIQGDPDADMCMLGWGSTWAAIHAAVQRQRRAGHKLAWIHLTHLNPLPNDLGEKLRRFPHGAGARAQPRSAVQHRARQVPDRRQARSARSPGSRSPPGRSKRRSRRIGSEECVVSDTAVNLTSKKDWSSDQEVRWCPGCGDYGILQAVQQLMPELGILPEKTVFISGIGCSSRFPYYMNTYGMHSIHGRAPAIATGLAVARPDLDVWVITGDGDGLSIGGNHLIHALRRNVNLKILLFNNRIYGLTKGQYSPTSEVGKVTKSTPFGSIDPPFNPLSVALGAEASFVARTHDLDRQHMMQIFRAAHEHRGASFVEIYQNCNVFNDGQFNDITKRTVRDEMMIDLVHGEPIVFGSRPPAGRDDGRRRLTAPGRGRRRRRSTRILVHDAHNPTRRWRSRSPGSTPTTTPPRRSACSASSNVPSTPAPSATSWRPRHEEGPRRPAPTCCAATAPGTSTDVQPTAPAPDAGPRIHASSDSTTRRSDADSGGSNHVSSSPRRSAAASARGRLRHLGRIPDGAGGM